MHSSDLSIITPNATKTFLNVRQVLQTYALESSCTAQAGGHHWEPSPSRLRPLSLSIWEGDSAWIALLQLPRLQNYEFQDGT